MPTLTTNILTSPITLYTTSITSVLISRSIISYVKNRGPIVFFRHVIKWNSIFYSIFSSLLFLAVLQSITHDFSQSIATPTLDLICSSPISSLDSDLKLVYYASKIYEYIDIFNVLAVGGVVNRHFWFHHFTTPYLTYSRVLLQSRGWKLIALLNTLHHAFMYAYFGGVTEFSGLLPWTGYAQLFAAITGEVWIIWGGCGEEGGLWANWLALAVIGTYSVLFWGDIRQRATPDTTTKSPSSKNI